MRGMDDLPDEIKFNICSFFSPRDLLCLSEVSWSWIQLCSEEELWRGFYLTDRIQWKHIENCYRPERTSLWLKLNGQLRRYKDDSSKSNVRIHTDVQWKNIYMQHFAINCTPSSPFSVPLYHPIPSPGEQIIEKPDLPSSPSADESKRMRKFMDVLTKSRSVITSSMTSIVSHVKVQVLSKVRRLPLVGEGIDGTAKDLLKALMWSSPSSFLQFSCLYPGIRGMGSGVGFTVDHTPVNIAALHRFWPDGTEVQDEWKDYFKSADGLVFVVDASLTSFNEKSKLHRIVTELLPNALPVLVLVVCPPSLPDDVTILGQQEIVERMELDSIVDRPWCVRYIEKESLLGVGEGLRWMVNKMK
eukprot:TRINITY_DN1934_c0_g1_i1.p1 TRINITY_DN1934_c0_g1~~TRINITY_DN1934_c0_g1_i1.p1  ORF type:complete len:358 (-),score=64.59 TRINITY_DN1934_c0_g1_i1:64-1137(-)